MPRPALFNRVHRRLCTEGTADIERGFPRTQDQAQHDYDNLQSHAGDWYAAEPFIVGACVPFTISHAAAVLPLHLRGKYPLPLSALMIGSMAPDFGYFFWHDASRLLTHSLSGLFIFALPAGLLVWLFYVRILEKTTITLLPDAWHTQFARTEPLSPALAARAAAAVLVGAVTHILWDSFTHRGTFATDALPFLTGRTPGFAWLPLYHFLHGLSSVVGLAILALWARHLRRQPARLLIRPFEISEQARVRAVRLLGLLSVLAAGAYWLPHAHSRYDAQLFYAAVGLMSGFFVVWCGIAAWMWIGARGPRR